jgi:hypothetical protein
MEEEASHHIADIIAVESEAGLVGRPGRRLGGQTRKNSGSRSRQREAAAISSPERYTPEFIQHLLLISQPLASLDAPLGVEDGGILGDLIQDPNADDPAECALRQALRSNQPTWPPYTGCGPVTAAPAPSPARGPQLPCRWPRPRTQSLFFD